MKRMRIALPLLMLILPGCIPGASGPRGYEPPPRQSAPPPRRDVPQTIDGDIQGLPTTRPAWEIRPVRADARRVAASSYTVRSGDTLRLIAVKTGAGSEAIARANGLSAPFTIHPGQQLRIPGGLYHAVADGETGIAIARAYRISWSRIVTANALEEPYILRAGMRLLIPEGATLAPPASASRPETIEERAARFHIDIDDIVTGGQPALAETEQPARPSPSPGRVLPATRPVAAPARLATGFHWPARGPILKRFGAGASGERNDGIKIGVPLDTPVLAAADGVVAYVGSDVPALGGLVILRHGDGWTSVYGHAAQLMVKRGQSVKRGQTIALSGESGFADRPELHFELRQGRTPVDPVPRLPSR